MVASEVQNKLAELIDFVASMNGIEREEYDCEDFEMFQDARTYSYQEVGVSAPDDGLVLRFPDGSQFQVTIVPTR